MQVVIDNMDGYGGVDYSMCVQFGDTAKVIRRLNIPTVCTLSLALDLTGLPQPALHGRVEVTAASGLVIFTGYVAARPTLSIDGQGEKGPVFITHIDCVSDELFLNLTLPTAQALLSGLSAEQDWSSLASLSATTGVTVSLAAQLSGSSRFEVAPGALWSETAGLLASNTGNAYRSIANAIQVSSIGEITHAVSASDTGLKFDSLLASDLRWLANDVTICGREEATAYVTEIFQGDGATVSFALSVKPFSPSVAQKTTILDLFQGTTLNPRIWTTVDAGSHLALTSAGLSCLGGTGREAETSVVSIREIELGGTLTIEATGVQVVDGSVGTILGLYTGSVMEANCFAGFAVIMSSSGTSVAATIRGGAAGSSMALVAGHLYTLRMRLISAEMERTRQSYYYLSGTTWNSLGGEAVPSGGLLECEIQDVTSGTPSVPVVLYSGVVSSFPTACVLGLLDSGSLNCSIKSVRCSQAAPLLVAVERLGETPVPQPAAAIVDGGACHITTSGTLEFYPANVPAAGSLIYVSYRGSARAVARQATTFSSSAGTPPPTSMWIGTVMEPKAWSSVDCENAALAMLGMATNPSVAAKGTYTCSTLQGVSDVWPGDMLQIEPGAYGESVDAVVRESTLTLAAGVPEEVQYAALFANDWAESISIKLSTSIPADVVLPEEPTKIANSLPSLNGLMVTSISGSVIGLNAGVSAPINGGFEIRRRDNTFGPGTDSDLVLRTGTQNITFPRAAPIEQYYVRMYDGATPPNYSLFSAAVFVNVPV